MSRVPALRHVLAPLVAVLVVALGVAAHETGTAGADGRNHAAVIIETGTEAHRVVISFDADSISGVEALSLVPGANVGVAGFAGLGAGVCSLFGVGHPTEDCLGTAGDPRYWAYWHVPAGQSGFNEATYARAGAGSVRVRNGDTEGWRFGTGEAPAFVQLEFPAPVTPATAPPVDSDPAPSVTGPGGSAGGEMGLPSKGSTTTTVAPTPEEAAAAAAAAGAIGSSTSSTTRKGTKTEVSAEQASANRDAEGGGSPLLSILGFAAVMAILAAGILFARRARVGNRPSAP
jgi:hypothetical protein